MAVTAFDDPLVGFDDAATPFDGSGVVPPPPPSPTPAGPGGSVGGGGVLYTGEKKWRSLKEWQDEQRAAEKQLLDEAAAEIFDDDLTLFAAAMDTML